MSFLPRTAAGDPASRKGGVAVEFALISLALYFVLAGMISLGRWMAVTQSAQDVARFAARECALYPLPASTSFEMALLDPDFRAAVYNPDLVVVDLDANPPGPALDQFFSALPPVNQALRPLMVTSDVETGTGRRRLLHMPGAIVDSVMSPNGLSVLVPRILARDPTTGAETQVELIPVLEEISPGAFALNPDGSGGLAGLRLNVPFQSATLTEYLPSNTGIPIEATELGGSNTIFGPGPEGAGPYSGSFGLGRLEAFGITARPFRRLVAAQALFRREILL